MLCRHALRAGLRRGPALRLRVPQLGARRPVAAPTRVLAAAVNTGTSWRTAVAGSDLVATGRKWHAGLLGQDS